MLIKLPNFLLLCLSTALITGCGQKAAKGVRFHENQCDQAVASPAIINQISDLDINSQKLLRSSSNGFSFLAGTSRPLDNMLGTVEFPVIVSISKFTNYFEKFNKQIEDFDNLNFSSSLTSWFQNGEGPSLEVKEKNIAIPISKEVRWLAEQGQRWESVLCNLDQLKKNKDKDVRDFLKLEKNKIVENKLSFRQKEKILGLCERGNGKNCAGKINNSTKKETVAWYYHNISKKFKAKVYDKLFSLSSFSKTARKYNCYREDSKIVMTIPSYFPNETVKNITTTSIQKYWNDNDRLEIKLDFKNAAGPNTFSIDLHDGNGSFVNSKRPNVINLSKPYFDSYRGNYAKVVTVIAHEFGHVLDFPDCYVEFYDESTKEKVYYEVEPGNLMCSLGPRAKIPEQYFEELISEKCSF
jgi:hypothetical protein